MSFFEFIHACERSDDVHITQAFCLTPDEILAEYCKYPYRNDTPKLFYSMTKTVASLAIGIAEDMELLSIEDPIVKFFPDLLPEDPDPYLDQITVRHLLTMSCGINEDTYLQLFVQDNWLRAFLAQKFPCKPGSHFLYCTHGTHMLSGIITRVSGLPLDVFVDRYLFHPMGIYEAKWEHSPEGLVAGGMGLSLCPVSLIKIAQLFLAKGVHNGKQLISARYLDIATSTQIIKQDYVGDPNYEFFGHEYGLQIHVGKHGYYRMEGSFGQLCLVAPDKNMAVIVFSQEVNFESLLRLVYTHLLGDEPPRGKLLESQPIITEAKSAIPPLGHYGMEQNDLGLQEVLLRGEGNEYEAVLRFENYENVIRFSPEGDRGGKIIFVKDLEDHLQEYVCRWLPGEGLSLRVYLIETPYVATYTFRPTEEALELDFAINVSFTLHDQTISGRRI